MTKISPTKKPNLNLNDVKMLKDSPSKKKICPASSVKSPIRSHELGAKNRSTSPNQGTENKSKVLIRGTEKRSTGTKLGSKIKSPDFKKELICKKDVNDLQSELVLSPSLKPVRVSKIIEKFEDNIKGELRQEQVKSAFGVLMMSGGGTLLKTPKRKLKRITGQKSTGKGEQSIEKWLRK